MQINIIVLISKKIHKKTKEGLFKKKKGKEITIDSGSILNINKKINFQ